MLVTLPPGVVKERSRRSNVANWREVNLVRWENDTLQPVKGWEIIQPGFLSPIRAAHKWISNAGIQYTAYLCEQHCYVEIGGSETFVDITPVGGIAPPPFVGSGGYGDGPYGTGAYGEPRDAVNRLETATPAYTLDNWGEELRVMTSSDGRLLRWDPADVSSKLTAVTNAPVGNRSFVVTPERHIILFGADAIPQQFMWSDQENDTVWTPGVTSKAGGFYIEPSSPIMAHKLTPNGVLMFTARGSYLIRYIGLPYVYAYESIGECSPPHSPAAITVVPEGAIWASLNGFWMYNGVSVSPVTCSVWDWITERMNVLQSRFRSAIVNISSRFEVWFFFVGGDDYVANNLAVIYNYKDKRWSMGKVGRTCGTASPNDPNPILADESTIYRHETGFNYPGSEKPWAETFTLNTARGALLTTIKQMLPEIDGDRGVVRYILVKRNDPTSGPEVNSSPKTIRSNGYVDVRETARDFRLRVEMVGSSDWSMGPIDIDMAGRGLK